MHILNDGYYASFLLLLPFISKTLNLNLTQVGFLGGLVGIMGIILSIPAGHYAAKLGGMKLLNITVLLYSAGFLLVSFANSFLMLIPLFLLAAAGFGMFHPIAFGLIAKLSEKSKRGTQVGTFSALGDTGKIGITAGLTFIIAAIGWRETSFLYGAVALLLLGTFLIIQKRRPAIHIVEKSKDLKIKHLLQNRQFILASLAGCLDVFASASLFIFIPFLLLHKGISPAILGSLIGAYFVGNLLGKTVLGRLTDTHGYIKVFVLSEIFMAFFILLLAYTNGIVFIVIVSVILGALTKGTVPVSQAMITDAVEHHGNFEKSMGLHSMFANVALAVSPILLGFISTTFGITYAFVVSAGFALLATIPALILPHVKHKE